MKQLENNCRDAKRDFIGTLSDKQSHEPLLIRMDKDSRGAIESQFYWPDRKRIKNFE